MESTVLQRISDDHRHITLALDALELQLDMDGNDDVNWNIICDILTYLQEYPDAVHHPLEDQLFDLVLDKGLTPAERELVHFNLAQHAEIIDASRQLADDVDNILNDVVVPIDRLYSHFERYLDIQRLHLRNETTHLLPMAQRLLSAEDWAEVGAQAMVHADPLFELQLEKYKGLYDYITGPLPDA